MHFPPRVRRTPSFHHSRRIKGRVLTPFLVRRIQSVIHPSLPPTCCVELPKSMQSTFARVTRFTTIIVHLCGLSFVWGGGLSHSGRRSDVAGRSRRGKFAEGYGGRCGSSTLSARCPRPTWQGGLCKWVSLGIIHQNLRATTLPR